MTQSGRNLVVLSDGTGNSASKAFKTNVWRLYQAIDLSDGTQVAVFGDGVGTSSLKVLRVLGLALGIGVKRNVLNLYKFLCRNYNENDRIWAFGFSRGAFTIRVLVGLIKRQGLVSFESEAELNRNALAAYRAYRREAFPTAIPWVWIGRAVRDWVVSTWHGITGARSYEDVRRETKDVGRHSIDVHFVGVWDTVVAYGLPIDELTQAVDKWVWPMRFRDRSLLPNVRHARHALSLDDERRTFHPVVWDETAEKTCTGQAAGRLQQVWFAGMHADVGGGYADDGLSLVPLGWMIDEAAAQGLRFEPAIVAEYAALATPTGRMYDSRAGAGAFWRYQPRDAQALLGNAYTPVVHGSVLTRMACGTDGYAPISLPEKIDVLAPGGGPLSFEAGAVQQALADAEASLGSNPTPEEAARLLDRRRVLRDADLLVRAAANPGRSDVFKLVLDTVWWRRIVYFVSLGFALVAGAFPLLAQYLRIGGIESFNDRAGGPVGWTVGLVKGFLPGFVEPWTSAVVRNPGGATIVVVGLLASLGLSRILQGRICDRARAAWNVRPTVHGATPKSLDRLKPTGERHALAKATLVLLAVALFTWLLSGPRKLLWSSLVAAVVFAVWWAIRLKHPVAAVDPTRPNPFLRFARGLRTSAWAVRGYRWGAQKAAPAVFLLIVALIGASVAHRGLFDLLSTGGVYCAAEKRTTDAAGVAAVARDHPADELLGDFGFATTEMCQGTGKRLVAGQTYRIRLEMDAEWFDKGRHTGVVGFGTDTPLHVIASPLKRWWRENWFQPIARIGEIGNNEHVLRPVAPVPSFVPDEKCVAARDMENQAWSRDIESPAPPAFQAAQLACDSTPSHVQPPRVLVSDITADATGELFLYVNDAVLTWPGWTNWFYRNNSGTAKGRVLRVVATEVDAVPKPAPIAPSPAAATQ